MKKILFTLFLLFVVQVSLPAADYPLTVTDSTRQKIILQQQPKRVVSLVPTVTEMLLRIGASEHVVGITYHSILPPETAGKTIIGGFSRPDMDKVAALQPDLIFYSDLHRQQIERFRGKIPLINLATGHLSDSDAHLRLLAEIFHRENAAEKIIAEEHRLFSLIADKTAAIDPGHKQRVMRLMGKNSIMTPGDDSFQSEYIRAAGGIAPKLGKNDSVVPVTLKEWQQFNPQFLYGCGDDKKLLRLLDQPGWREVDAVKNSRYIFFACDLTCRAATHTGHFVAWLAASIYQEEFSDPTRQVLPEKVIQRTPLNLDLEYVKKAEKVESDIRDFRNTSVVIEFNSPMKVVSTLEGQRSGISTIGNHYFPPPAWGLGQMGDVEAFKKHTVDVLGVPLTTSSFLFTGADMDNLAIEKRRFKEMEVTALVTAGVEGNAMRAGKDEGLFYEPEHLNPHKKPGTINILLLTNMQLSPRAMTRAIICATEGKTAALEDLDIRSSYSGKHNSATGTGTDNVLVAEGRGTPVDSSGGHTKMGELISQTVYEGVREAIHLQNGLTEKRPIFQRLRERKIDIRQIGDTYSAATGQRDLAFQLERLMLDPAYSSFIESAMAISDDVDRGLIRDLSGFTLWCQAISRQLAGKDVQQFEITNKQLPIVMRKAFGALIAGLSNTNKPL